VVAIFCDRLLNDQKAIINGDGGQTRDFVFVKDVVESNLKALDYLMSEQTSSDIFNIGTGVETDINTVFKILKEKTGSHQSEIHDEAKPGEQRRSVLDFSKAKNILSWEPKYGLDQGLTKTVEYYKAKTF
jgi:UDP-glucose 4-epimerase